MAVESDPIPSASLAITTPPSPSGDEGTLAGDGDAAWLGVDGDRDVRLDREPYRDAKPHRTRTDQTKTDQTKTDHLAVTEALRPRGFADGAGALPSSDPTRSRSTLSLPSLSRRGLLSTGAGLCGLASVSGWASSALAETLATGFRIGLHTNRTRVVVDLSGQPVYRLFTLVNPPRLVVDLHQADWLVPAGALPGPAGHVRSVRHGLLDNGLTRVVLDLDGPAQVQDAFVLTPREGYDWRLVIDLTDTSAAAFRAAAGVEQAIEPRSAQAMVPGHQGRTPGDGLPGGDLTHEDMARNNLAGAEAEAGSFPNVADAGREEIPPLPSILAPPPSRNRPPDPVAPRPVAAPPMVPAGPPVVAARPVPLPRPAPRAEIVPASLSADPGPMVLRAGVAPPPGHKPLVPRKPLIALDPGHGGKDPGAISVNGIYEKDIVLAAAKELRRALLGTGRFRVFMTRDSDVSVHLRERVRRARQAQADLFLSIHADAIRNPNVRGLSVYTLSEKASDAEAGALADRENKADIILGMDFSAESPDVTNILIDLAQRETMNRSVRFANTLLSELPQEVRTLNHSRRYAGFAVLKAPDVPSALMEMGYLSNHTEEKLLRQRAYRAKLMQAVVQSMDRFFTVVQGAQRP